MNDFIKWAVIAVVAFLAFRWLKSGISGAASFQAQANPSGWGSGMIYAPGSAWGTAYGYIPQTYPQFPYQGSTPIYASYTPDGGISFQYGF